MKRVIVSIALTALTILALTYGRWIVSDLLWLHEQRGNTEALAKVQAMQQGARR
ncbi:hypothetical protein UFOVP509_47 [uncultured Caudovirales phage]|uniref:Uncharacterized protein n=1 Tax=uncultured Caudovirales phage TaxID=2100421 RepID=A0A6J5MLU8_9CAUD|nr:hypothetical protein UFOVP509_47 [uncultured Caudovirales phage]